jgi:hypothetical protein
MKSGIRIMSIGTGPAGIGKTILIGIISRNGTIEGAVSTKITVDDIDSTEKVIALLKKSRFSDQVRLIVMNGIGLAGLNIVDIYRVAAETECGVLSITRKKPHPNQLVNALRALARDTGTDTKQRIALVNKIKMANMFRSSAFYAQTTMKKEDAAKFIPQAVEQLRLVHIIARGISTGESKGRI